MTLISQNKLNLSQDNQLKFNKLLQGLRRQTGKAIADFNMLQEGDKVMVCLSGGKDSYTLLHLLMLLQKSAPIHFDLVAVNLDQKQPDFPEEVLPNYLTQLGVDFHILEEDTYSLVQEKLQPGKTSCSLCSRLRRGSLYTFAKKIGATKIALGHHQDDLLETLFLNMFFAGSLKAMPPKLLSDDKQHIIIRPLAYCREKDIAAFSELIEFPIIPCNLCGSQPNLQRQEMKAWLNKMEADEPQKFASLSQSIFRLVPSHLGDPTAFDFASLEEEQAQALAQRIQLVNELATEV